MKRFFKTAAVGDAAGGYTVLLDAKPMRTPAKAPFVVRSKQLAEAIAAEWQTQGETIKPSALPLTRLVGTAIDLVAPRHESIVTEIAKYATTDLVCYRAEAPSELAARQQRAWQPHLDWAGARYAPLTVTAGIAPVTQAPEALAAYREAVAAYDDMTLTALHLATTTLGSLVLALALIEGRIAADEAFAAAELDQSFQIERWGEDAEATARRSAVRDDIGIAARFAALHRAA
ncbi:MAG TPA: ATP12 family protein [Stellaceae bacterium]|nr:ATP12 family protein [Stellaceae bacterium]